MPRLYRYRALTAFVSMLCLAGCEAAKSANPTAPSVAGPIPGVNITAPRAARAVRRVDATFRRRAADAADRKRRLERLARASGCSSKSAPMRSSSRSSTRPIRSRSARTAARRTACRRRSARATPTTGARARVDGANIGPYSAVSSFNVVPPVVIDAPVATAPSGTLTTNKPDFKVTNGAHLGTSGVGYRFEVSKSARLHTDRSRSSRCRSTAAARRR